MRYNEFSVLKVAKHDGSLARMSDMKEFFQFIFAFSATANWYSLIKVSTNTWEARQ